MVGLGRHVRLQPPGRGGGLSMRILWVKVGGLWPTNTGGRLRSFHILAELARHHRVTLATTHAPGEDPKGLETALAHCERVISVPYASPKWRSLRFPFVLLRSWASSMPVDIWKCRVPALRREVSRLLDSGQVDLCIADFLFAMPNIPETRVPLMFFAHNVEHMIWTRLWSVERRPALKTLLDVEWRKMQRYEAGACRRARLTVAVSRQDKTLLEENSPGALIRDVPTGVDVGYFKPNGAPHERANLVFTGSMDWHPNEDAILYFIKEMLPAIRREIPDAALTVVGRNPGLRLQEAAREAGVSVTGTVDDVRPYVDAASVYVVPLRIGGGTRLKIFEALAMGKAVVSTSVGAEGLPLVSGEHFLCADEPESFATAVVGLLRDPARRLSLGEAGRRLTEERYAWPQVAREFGSCCETALG